MHIIIDDNTTVNELQDGSIIVTRPTIMGKVASHVIRSPYRATDIAAWLASKLGYTPRSVMVQQAFPEMSDEDREFLISGITPDAWARMFPKEDNDE